MLTHEIALVIKDIGEVTKKEDEHISLVNLSENFSTIHLSTIKSLRKA